MLEVSYWFYFLLSVINLPLTNLFNNLPPTYLFNNLPPTYLFNNLPLLQLYSFSFNSTFPSGSFLQKAVVFSHLEQSLSDFGVNVILWLLFRPSRETDSYYQSLN